MTKLYCSYDGEYWVDSYPDPDDEWDQGSYGGTYYVTGVSLAPGFKDAYDTDEDISIGDTVYVVYVSYYTGNTFGTSGGHGQIVAATKNDEYALMAQQWCEDMITKYKRRYSSTEPKEPKEPIWPERLPKLPYTEFTGYFEHNQQVRLQEFIVSA